MGGGSKTLESPILDDDQQKYKNSSMMTTQDSVITHNGYEKQQFTWDEIHRHSTKTDRWIVIENHVYDISNWLRHPGGQKLLNYTAGQDATEPYRAFHPNIALVQKYLKSFYIGDVNTDTNKSNYCSKDQELKEDFEKIRQKAIAKKLFEPSRFFFFISCLHILALEIAAYFVIFRFGDGWIPYLITILLYVVAEAQCAWLQHDFGHLSVFKKSSWNHLFHQMFLGFVQGASADWWNNMHYQHHTKPNIIDKDPDTRVDPLFLLGNKIPIRKAEQNVKHGKVLPYHLQHLYFFITAPLLFPVYFQFMAFRHVYTRQKWGDLVWLSSFYIKYFSIMPLKLGFWSAFKLLFVIRALEGTWFVVVSQSNHVVMDVSYDDLTIPWFRLQLKGTCNIIKSAFNDWFTGHLNFQIEHHLFPTMPRHNLYKIQPDIIALCEKYNIPYVVKPMGRAFVDIILSLQKSGQMWLTAYEELKSTSKKKQN